MPEAGSKANGITGVQGLSVCLSVFIFRLRNGILLAEGYAAENPALPQPLLADHILPLIPQNLLDDLTGGVLRFPLMQLCLEQVY